MVNGHCVRFITYIISFNFYDVNFVYQEVDNQTLNYIAGKWQDLPLSLH